MNKQVTFKQKEAKILTLTINENGNPVNLTGTELFLGVKKHKNDVGYVFSKADADFNKAQAASGIVTVFLTPIDLDQEAGPYVAELRVGYLDGTIDKSTDLILVINQAITS